MKEAMIESLDHSVRELVDDVQAEDILILEDGEPVAIVHGLREPDDEAEFWVDDDPELLALLRRRANEPTVPFDEVLKQLAAEES